MAIQHLLMARGRELMVCGPLTSTQTIIYAKAPSSKIEVYVKRKGNPALIEVTRHHKPFRKRTFENFISTFGNTVVDGLAKFTQIGIPTIINT